VSRLKEIPHSVIVDGFLPPTRQTLDCVCVGDFTWCGFLGRGGVVVHLEDVSLGIETDVPTWWGSSCLYWWCLGRKLGEPFVLLELQSSPSSIDEISGLIVPRFIPQS
jgi:hypothetical protein